MFLNLYCLIMFAVFCGIVLWKIKFKSHPNTREEFLQNLNELRGIFALEVVFGHLVRYEYNILFPFGKFMICSVAFFFFVSAFGMVVSFEKKENYLGRRFIISKPLYLLAIAVVIYIFEIIVDIFAPYGMGYLSPNPALTFLHATNWYIWELILFYFIFWISYKFFYKFRLFIIGFVAAVLAIVFYQCGLVEMWYASILGFPAGLLFSEFYDKIAGFLRTKKGVLLTVVLSLFGLMSMVIRNENIVSMVFMRNAICLAAIIVIFYVCDKMKIGNNAVARFLCVHSTEIYLSQFVWLSIAEHYQLDFMIKVPCVLFATIMTAVVIHPVISWLRKVRTIVYDKKCF